MVRLGAGPIYQAAGKKHMPGKARHIRGHITFKR